MKNEWLSNMRKGAKPDINNKYFYFVKSTDISLFSILQPKNKLFNILVLWLQNLLFSYQTAIIASH